MALDKRETIHRLCQLVTKVRDREFDLSVESDCFCDMADPSNRAVINPMVIEFIEAAVDLALSTSPTRDPYDVDHVDNREIVANPY